MAAKKASTAKESSTPKTKSDPERQVLSSQHQFSTYRKNEDVPHQVIQELGPPVEGVTEKEIG